MKVYAILAALLVLASGAAQAGSFSRQDAGTTGAQFLKLGAGARATALGGAFTGIADDATAVYWNPAGMCHAETRSVSLMHAAWFEDIYYDWVSYVHPTKQSGVFGFGVQYLSYGKIPEADVNGIETGSFTPNDSAVTVAYAFQITPEDPELARYSDILVGASFKYISSSIKTSARAYAGDLGALYTFPGNRLALGMVLQNIGTTLAFPGGSDPLPVCARLGGGYRIGDPLLVSLDLSAPSDNEPYLSAGMEYSHMMDLGVGITLRAGYSTLSRNIDGLTGVSGGAGLQYMTYRLDYAFVPFGDLGGTHRVSFGITF